MAAWADSIGDRGSTLDMKLPNLPRLTSDYGRRQKVFSLALGLAVGILMCLLYVVSGGEGSSQARQAEQFVYDSWVERFFQVGWKDTSQVLSPEVAQTVVLVVVDDQTLERGFPWPLPRDRYLDIIRRLEKAGARTIALDILFGAPGPDTPEGSTALSPKDRVLSEALARPSVIVPYTIQGKGPDAVAAGVYPPLLEGWTDEDFERRFGFTKELADADKKVRRAVLEIDTLAEGQTGKQPYYAFDIVALAHYRGISPKELLAECSHVYPQTVMLSGSEDFFSALYGNIAYFAADLVTLDTTGGGAEPVGEGELRVLQDSGSEGRWERRIHALSDHLTVVPLYEILEAPEDQLPGFFGSVEDPATGVSKPLEVIALVGVTVSGGHDLKVSPIGPISGVGIHANVMGNLIQHNFQREVGFPAQIGLMLGLALFASLVSSLLEVRFAAASFALGMLGYFLLGFMVYQNTFIHGAILLPTAIPLTVAIASFGMVTVWNVRAQKVAKDKFAKILQEVAPIPDLEALLGKDGLKVGSEERILTILFSDIRGYTDLSESLDAVTVTEMLNTYHGAMGEIFDRYGGVVFDYQGDAQMVVFGLVPASQPNHAAAACKAGVGMVLRLEKLRQEWQSQGRPVFETGVGVCTGPVAIGILGSAQRKQYAAIGDPTNTAARMQGKSKDLDSPVLITQSTYEAAGDEIIAEFIEAVRVKGKREPLQVYGVDIQAMEEKMGVHA